MKSLNRFGWASLALLLWLGVASSVRAQGPAGNLPDAIKQVDTLTAAEFAKDSRGSVTIGIVSGSDLVWTKSYGDADMEKKIPASKDTVYRIGSITKQFTAVMLLQLVESGKVSLSDPVEKYFPDVNKVQEKPAGTAPITLGQLGTHTSGLGREPADTATYVTGPVSEWEKTLIAALPHTRYDFAPGARFSYSNIGYAILGATLARASGQAYVDYVPAKIFGPLGMTHTAFEPNAQIKANIAKGYDIQGAKVDADTPEREHQGRGYKVPNGAIYTTVGDMARFVSFELGHGPDSVLPKARLDANFKSVPSTNGVSNDYGIGFEVLHQGGLTIYGHGGAVAGYLAAAYFDRASDKGIIVLRNVAGGAFNPDTLALNALVTVATGRPPATASADVQVDPKVLARYVGAYQMAPGVNMLITLENNQLISQMTGQSTVPVSPKSETTFVPKGISAELEFSGADAQGRATQLTLTQNGRVATMKRLDDTQFKELSDAAAALAKRIKDQTPTPGAEAALRQVIEGVRSGSPNYERMSDGLATAVRQQLTPVQATLVKLGAVKSVIFKGIGPAGPDIYQVEFENGVLEYRIVLAPDGKIQNLNFRAVQ